MRLASGHCEKTGAARLDVLHAQFVDGKTVGEFDCGLDDFGQRLGAKLIERHDTGVKHRRNRGGQRASRRNRSCFGSRHCRHARGRSLFAINEELTSRLHRSWAHALDDADILALHLDENWHLAAERKVGKLDHRSSEDCCHAGIRSIAALLQNAHSCFNRERVTTGHHSALAANYRSKRLRIEMPAADKESKK